MCPKPIPKITHTTSHYGNLEPSTTETLKSVIVAFAGWVTHSSTIISDLCIALQSETDMWKNEV